MHRSSIMRRYALPPALIALSLLAACTAGEQMKMQVEGGHIHEASRIYNENPEFFTNSKNKVEYRAVLGKVAAGLNAEFAPGLKRARERLAVAHWPALVPDWKALRRDMAFAQARLTEYSMHRLLLEPAYSSPEYLDLQAIYDPLRDRIVADAPAQFAAYDHFSAPDRFIGLYPVPLPEHEFISSNLWRIDARLAKADTAALRRFLSDYPKGRALSDAAYGKLSDYYLAAQLRESGNGKKTSFAAFLQALQDTRNAGFEPTPNNGHTIAVVVLPDSAGARFNIDYMVDLPAELMNAVAARALSSGVAAKADYVMVIKRTSSDVTRQVVSSRQVGSRYLSGYSREDNPDYRDAELDLRQAESDFDYQSSKLANAGDIRSLSADLHRAEARRDGRRVDHLRRQIDHVRDLRREVDYAKNRVDTAISRLRETPAQIDVPVYSSYDVEYRTVRLIKRITLQLSVVDRPGRKYLRTTYTGSDQADFRLVHGLRVNDINRALHLKGASDEHDLDSWARRGYNLSVRALAAQYLAKQKTAKRLPSARQIVADIAGT